MYGINGMKAVIENGNIFCANAVVFSNHEFSFFCFVLFSFFGFLRSYYATVDGLFLFR